MRLVTPECATEELGAPPRPAGPAPRPLPPARRRRPAHFLPGPPLSGGGLSGPPRHSRELRAATAGRRARAQSGPRVRYGESGGGVRLPQQQPPPPSRLPALDRGSRRPSLRPCRRLCLRAGRCDGVSGPAAREKRAAPRTRPGLLCARQHALKCISSEGRPPSRGARLSAAFCAPPPLRTNSNASLALARSLFSFFFFFGLEVSGTEEGRQGPMCGRIASAPQTCADFRYFFGPWFCSDFFRIVANSPLFPGCSQSLIRNFFSTGSHWCRSVCNEPRECYCSLHFCEPPSAQLRPRRPQGVYRD